MENNRMDKLEVICRQLDLINDINRDIEISKKLNNPLMVRQYEHLKKEYTRNFLKILDDYKMSIGFLEAA